MQPNDENLPENNMPEPQPAVDPTLTPEQSQPPVEQPADDPMVTPAPQAMDVTTPPPAQEPPQQPVAFQPPMEGEQPQPIQSVPVEPPKPTGFFGKIKSMFSKK